MNYKRLLFCSLFLMVVSSSFAQISVEGQLGGSNFLGLTLNTNFPISLNKKATHKLTPTFGMGILAPGWAEPTTILHFGLNYSVTKWGAGVEVSGFTSNPFWGDGNATDFIDMLVYPNFNYTINTKSNWFYKFSAGAYFAFSKYYNSDKGRSIMEFEGDVIPGIGISVGYKLESCK